MRSLIWDSHGAGNKALQPAAVDEMAVLISDSSLPLDAAKNA
jgi:hypothetical protein